MITFFSSVILLILGYFIYSKIIAKVVGLNSKNPVPSHTLRDNMDFLPMSKPKNSLINLLNIAGTGPVFGPILAALYGPVALLWIVFGAIFAGAVHDFVIGVVSLRNKGGTLPTLAAIYLSKPFKHIVNFFSCLLLILVATVFVVGPATLLHNLLPMIDYKVIIGFLFSYYLLATLLPVDKIIGKIYPFFGVILIIGAVAIIISVLFFSKAPLPELNLNNLHPQGLPLFPLLFLTLSCGALSGFHATQIPIISRTLNNETEARPVFYGMMIAEGIIALIWAYATIVLLDGQTLLSLLKEGTPSLVVNKIALMSLGGFLGTIAVLGVIVLPFTSGDTAFRGIRLMLAEYLKLNQKSIKNRFIIAIPCFAISIMLCFVNFQYLWQYFSWANQTLASISLWISTMYLLKNKKPIYYTLVPALFITFAVFTYILYAPIGFSLDLETAKIIALIMCAGLTVMVLKYQRDYNKSNLQKDNI